MSFFDEGDEPHQAAARPRVPAAPGAAAVRRADPSDLPASARAVAGVIGCWSSSCSCSASGLPQQRREARCATTTATVARSIARVRQRGRPSRSSRRCCARRGSGRRPGPARRSTSCASRAEELVKRAEAPRRPRRDAGAQQPAAGRARAARRRAAPRSPTSSRRRSRRAPRPTRRSTRSPARCRRSSPRRRLLAARCALIKEALDDNEIAGQTDREQRASCAPIAWLQPRRRRRRTLGSTARGEPTVARRRRAARPRACRRLGRRHAAAAPGGEPHPAGVQPDVHGQVPEPGRERRAAASASRSRSPAPGGRSRAQTTVPQTQAGERRPRCRPARPGAADRGSR